MVETKKNTLRDNILAAARDLILSRGFSAMTIDAVCAAAGVTKGGFFYHFGSKEALGEAVLDQFWQDVQKRQNAANYQQAKTDIDFVIGYFDHAIEAYQDPILRQGCMLAIFTMELSESYPELYKSSALHFQSWKAELRNMLEKLANSLHLNDFDALSWSEMYMSTLEGALLLSKASADSDVIVRTLQLYKKQLISHLKLR